MNLDFELAPAEVWVEAAIIALSVFATFLVVRAIGRFVTHRFSGADEVSLRAVPARLLDHTSIWVPAVLSLWAGSLVFDFRSEVADVLRAIAVLAAILQVALWGTDLVAFWAERYRARSAPEAVAATTSTIFAVRFVATLVLWAVLLLLALDNVGIEVTTLVAGLGIGGIAVALAAQSVLGDLFASIAIVVDQPFVEGDFIVTGDIRGTVEKVGVKTTRIRSLDGEQLVIPNNDLVSSRIHNYKRMDERRVLFTIGVEYGTTAEQMELAPRLIREAIEAQEGVRFDRAHFRAFADFSLNIEAVYFVLSPEYGVFMETHQAVNMEILRTFREAGIAFAFPTQTLHLVRDGAAETS
ncbi:MAG: mechanosensitive ion channel family protein [Dehalococcoidia bacterium]